MMKSNCNKIFRFFLLCTLFLPVVAFANDQQVLAHKIKLQKGYQSTVVFLGKAATEKTSDVSFDVSGLIEKIYVNDGHNVQQGAPLASLNLDRLNEREKQLNADIESTSARLVFAKKEYARSEKLVKDGHISKQVFQRDFRNMKTLEANLVNLKAQLTVAKIDIKKATLIAPYNAVVLERFVHEGQFVQSGKAIMKLQETQVNQLYVGVPHAYIDQVKKGQCHFLFVGNKKIEACIENVLPSLSNKTQTARVVFVVKDKSPILSGQTVQWRIKKLNSLAGSWLPSEALVQGLRRTWLIYSLKKIAKSNRYQVVSIQVHVVYADDNQVYVTGRFKNNDLYVATGTHKISPGLEVRVIKDNASE